jgi:hypothetical protein
MGFNDDLASQQFWEADVTLHCACAMSALPPKADIDQHGRDVRFVPLTDIGT